ncbi:ATP-binding cassette sub-family A member 17-like [Trichogramma pretiosum]|uniref:ATP-binding cassette sub-family A member 17-like n=1 Tax=Trichogramma pretiosum TaxID=7493 RepID=UPI0006C972D8|nr:ATP-binding cassette sub-family A member 17-like [Trichogramma pretiosum]
MSLVDSVRMVIYKNYAWRKKQWGRTLLLQCLAPLAALLVLWLLWGGYGCQPLQDDVVDYPEIRPNSRNESYYGNGEIYYAPASNFTDDLMKRLQDDCLAPRNARYRSRGSYHYLYDRYGDFEDRIEVRGFETEADLLHAYRNVTMRDSDYTDINIVSVLFDNYDRSRQRLDYRLRASNLHQENLYVEVFMIDYYWKRGSKLAAIQGCLDQQFIQMNALEPEKARFNVTLQSMPRLRRDEGNPNDCINARRCFRLVNGLSVLIFLLPLLVEVFAWSRDQRYGSNLLLSYNRLCASLDQLVGYTNSLLLLGLLLVVPATLLFTVSSSTAVPLIVRSSPLLFGLMMALYLAHLLSFGLVVSSVFPHPWLAMFITVVVSVGSMALPTVYSPYDTDSPILHTLPYLSAIFPNVFWYLALNEFDYKEFYAEGANWDDLFNVGQLAYGFSGSLGMLMVFAASGATLYLFLALLINCVKCRLAKSCYVSSAVKNRWLEDHENTMSDPSGKGRIERPSVQQSTPAVQIRNLNVSSMKQQSGLGISIDFYKGEIVSLVDFDGVYKTRLLSTLCGLCDSPKGAIKVNSLSMECHADKIVNDIGFFINEDLIFPNLSVYENLKFFAKLKRNMRAKSNVDQDIATTLEKFRLFHKRFELACNLNSDLKRQLCVAMAMVANTDIVVLDEPTKDLDADAKRIIWDNIKELRGLKSVIIGTKSIKEAELVGDRIAVMLENRIDAYGTPSFLRDAFRSESSPELGVVFRHGGSVDEAKIADLLQDPRTAVRRESEHEFELAVPDTQDTKKALESLDQLKAEIGVTSFTILYPTLEDIIFSIDAEKLEPVDVKSPLDRENVTTVGNEGYREVYAAMKRKKAAYVRRNPRALLIVFGLIMAAVAYLSFVFLQGKVVELAPRVVRLRPDLYRDSETFYSSGHDAVAPLGRAYESASRQWGAERTTEVVNSSLVAALVNEARTNKTTYLTRVVAAAEFNATTAPTVNNNGTNATTYSPSFLANALYSRDQLYSLPISLNLIGNALAKALVGREASISASVQSYPRVSRSYYWFRDGYLYGTSCSLAIALLFLLVSASYFLRQPADERRRGFWYLQRMANVSSWAHWRSVFVHDLAMWMSFALFLLVSLMTVDKFIGAGIFKSVDILLLELFLFLLYGFNVLPLVYIFSFIPFKLRTLTVFMIFMMLLLSMITIFVPFGMGPWEQHRFHFFGFLFPFYTFYFSQKSVFAAIAQENRCEAVKRSGVETCDRNNYDRTCCYNRSAFVRYWDSSGWSEDSALSTAYLVFVPVIYFAVLLLIDSRALAKTLHLFKVVQSGLMSPMLANNDKMQKEKAEIANKIAQMNDYTYKFVSSDSRAGASRGALTSRASVPVSQQQPSEMLLVHELRKASLQKFVLYDASFRVARGECFGLYGLKGAGKTSVLELVTGVSFTNYGYLYLDGVDLLNSANSPRGRAKARQALSRVGYCPASSFLLDSLSAREHLELFARLRAVPADLVDSEVQFWLKTAGLTDLASEPSCALGCGKKRRLMLAATLVGNPKLIVLDEPSAGVDPETRKFVWRLIRSLRAAGKTVLMTTSSSEEAAALCDRIGVLLNGTLVDFETPETLMSNKHVRL